MKLRAAFALALSISACRSSTKVLLAQQAGAVERHKPPQPPGLEPVDTEVSACDDFYQHVCGPWLASNPRPPQQPVWSRSFSVAENRVRDRLRRLLGEAPGKSDKGGMSAYWEACIDEQRRNAEGISDLETIWKAIEHLRLSRTGDVLGLLHAHGIQALFRLRRGPGQGAHALVMRLAGTGLGPASMYEASNPRLAEYRQHVAAMLRLASLPDAVRRADSVVAFEAKLAALQAVDSAERDQAREMRSLAELRKTAPKMDWDAYFVALKQPAPDHLVASAAAMKGLHTLLQDTDTETVKDYFRWQTVHWNATILPPAFAAEHRRMYEPEVANATLDELCISEVEAGFGPLLGQYYIQRYVSSEDRKRLRALAERLRGALRTEVERATWIDGEAREAMVSQIEVLGLSLAEMAPAAEHVHASGFLRASLEFRKARIAAELAGQATHATPLTAVNAAMMGAELQLFAGMIQSPFYVSDMPEPILLGAIGQILAHEFGHTLDPETLADVIKWAPNAATSAAYKSRLKCVSDSYEQAEISPGVHVDGDAVVKEMFADNLGLRLAHSLTRSGGREAERQFFVAWGQLQCTSYDPAILAMMAETDVAPAPLRVNQPLALFPGFSSAFACSEGTRMNPVDRCAPW